MAYVYPTLAIEMELAGVGAGWTNVTGDVRAIVPIRWRYGIDGNQITDRVASPGSLTFAMNNAATNSGGLLGYYAPGHTNCRSGFGLGINVRLKLTYSAVTYVKFHGRLSHIQPMPGQYGERTTLCAVYDWMDEALRAKLKRIAIQINKRSDQIFSTIVTAMVRQPVSTTVGTGLDTYKYALDASPEEGLSVLTEFQRIAQSETGFIYAKGNTTNGGEVVFESRTDRATKNTNLSTFDNSMIGLGIARSRDDIISRLQVVTHPRRIDTVNQVLFTLRDPNVSTDSAISLGPGESCTKVCTYTDPSDRNHRIGGTGMQPPVATTDYLFNAQADGLGSDLTASLGISVTFAATAGFVTLTNNHATTTGYVTFLQLRGLGIYDEQTVIAEQTSSAAETAFGEQTFTYDMPYQSDANVGDGAARYFLALLAAQTTNPDSITILANTNDALMTAALAREPGDRIGFAEAASGVSSTAGYFIQSCDGEYRKGGIVTMTWGLAPASWMTFWLLGTAGSSELESSTYVGF